jgi:hypothetical protein
MSATNEDILSLAASDIEWAGLGCSCGGGWRVGHREGCPELQDPSSRERDQACLVAFEAGKLAAPTPPAAEAPGQSEGLRAIMEGAANAAEKKMGTFRRALQIPEERFEAPGQDPVGYVDRLSSPGRISPTEQPELEMPVYADAEAPWDVALRLRLDAWREQAKHWDKVAKDAEAMGFERSIKASGRLFGATASTPVATQFALSNQPPQAFKPACSNG